MWRWYPILFIGRWCRWHNNPHRRSQSELLHPLRNCGIDVTEVRFGAAGELHLLHSLLNKALFPFDILFKGGRSFVNTYLVLGILGLVTISEHVQVQVILQYKENHGRFFRTRQPQLETPPAKDEDHTTLQDGEHIGPLV